MIEHYRKLERMYHKAPLNEELYHNTLVVSDAKAELSWEVNPTFFHAARSLHGSVYFKLLDDAAYFAAASLVKDVFILTSQFNVHLIRPVTAGSLIAKGEVISNSRQLILARSSLFNEKGKLIAEGSGSFMRGKTPLSQELGYE